MGEIRHLVNIADPRFDRFGPFFKESAEKSDHEGKEFDAIVIPKTINGRVQFSARLRGLVEQEWKTRNSKVKDGIRAYTGTTFTDNERVFEDALYEEDIAAILHSLDAIMPAPDDNAFGEFVKSRTTGVIRAMQLLVKTHSKLKDSDIIRREAQLLGKTEIIGRGGVPKLPRNMPVNIRRPVMGKRVYRIGTLAESLPNLEVANQGFYNILSQEFSLPEERLLLNDVCAAFDEKSMDFACSPSQDSLAPEVVQAHWWHVLQNKLNNWLTSLKKSGDRDVIVPVMRELAADLRAAKTTGEFMNAIDGLGAVHSN
jgi:hypothetical protein